MAKYLDEAGVKTLVSQIKTKVTSDINTAKTAAIDDAASKYQPKGSYATLTNGKVPPSQLPSYVDDVKDFNSIVTGKMVATGTAAAPMVWNVVFDTTANRFVAEVTSKDGNTGISPFLYYANFTNSELYGTVDGISGIKPEADKIYVCTSNNKVYRWGGSSLVEISAQLVIGDDPGQAYDGSKGAANASAIDAMKKGNREVPAPVITGTFTWYKDNGAGAAVTSSAAGTSANNSLELEYGFHVKWAGTYKYTKTDAQKPVTVTSGSWGTTVLASGTASSTYTADKTSAPTTAQTMATVTLSAPKEGLVVSGSDVKWASGQNDTKTANVYYGIKYRTYAGNTAGTTDADLKKLANGLYSKANREISFTVPANQYVVYAYPKSWGELKEINLGAVNIKTSAFTLLTVSHTSDETGYKQDYYVYRSTNATPFGVGATTTLKFNF